MSSQGHKLLFISDNFPPVIGGSAVVYDQLCRYNSDLVVALTSEVTYQNKVKSGAQEYDETCGFTIYRRKFLRAPERRAKAPRLVRGFRNIVTEIILMLSIMRQIAQICRRHKVEAVCIGELVYGGWMAIYAKYLLRKKVAIYTHGEEISQEGGSFYTNLRGFFLDKADVLFVVSLFCKSQIVSLFKIDPDKIKVILNGVNLDVFQPGEKDQNLVARYALEDQKVVLATGRHVERKGFDRLIESFDAVREAIPNTRLLIVGDGPQTPELRQMVAEAQLDEVVTFVGRVSDDELRKLYRLADVFAMPNRTLPNGDTEGFGLVFLEANACGTPVVGGKGGGAIEAVIDGRTGLTVNGENVTEIAAALIDILGHDERRKAMGQYGLELARQSSWQSKAAEFAHSIQDLIVAPKGSYKPGNDVLRNTLVEEISAQDNGDLKLLLTIDLEEAFDWGNVTQSEGIVEGVDAVKSFHHECAVRGMRPTYFATYKMLTTPEVASFLKDARARGECAVGIHPHAWNTPPYLEDMNEFNTFQCNLPKHVEAAKIANLVSLYKDVFGDAPISHRAGRYGVDAASYDVLEKNGIQIDFSPSSGYDYRVHGGPNFSDVSNFPFHVGSKESILCIPVPSENLIKGPDTLSQLYYTFMAESAFGDLGKPIRLTPEGNTLARMKLIAKQLLKSGLNEIVISLHSTSLHVGGNPYSDTQSDVDRIKSVLFAFTDWLYASHAVTPALPYDVLQSYAGRLQDGR